MAQTYEGKVNGQNKSYSFTKAQGYVTEMINGKPFTRAMIEQDISLLFAEIKSPSMQVLSNRREK